MSLINNNFLVTKAFIFFLISLNALSMGTFQGVGFRDGIPTAGIEIVLDGIEVLKSNEEGQILKELTDGRHFFEIKNGEEIQTVSFVIGDDEVTQVLINTFSNNVNATSSISEPELKKRADPNAPKGQIIGKVINNEGEKVAGAKVFVTGLPDTYVTNTNGEFTIMAPEGRYSLSVIHKLYATQVLPNQTVMEGKEKRVNISLLPTGLELEEFVVVAPHVKGSLASLIEVRRKASTVADVLGAEQMSKSGDSNAASSLARVTGLTVVDGRFVYIRGLGERYSNVLLNGTSLPSPDPTRRVVQLDLFPSGILESMVIQKSYSPELPGSFGGGAVNLKTKDIPDEFTAKVTLSTSYEDGQGEMLNYQGGNKDWIGIDDGTRKLPDAIANATANGRNIPVGSPDSVAYGLALNRNYNVTSKKTNLPPGLSFSIGDTLRYRGKKFGANFAGLYSDRFSNDEIFRQEINAVSASEQSVDGSRLNRRSRRDVNLSGMLNLGMDLGAKADIRSNTLLLRKTSNRIEVREVKTQDNNLEETYFEWQERQLFSQILSGTHQLGSDKDRQFIWKGSFSQAEMDQPDTKFYQHIIDNGVRRFDNTGRSNERVFGQVKDIVREGEAKFRVPLIKSKNFSLISKVGAGIITKKRESSFKRFKYDVDTARAATITGNPNLQRETPEEICSDEVIRQGACNLIDTTTAADRFEANQTLRSYFLETETKAFESLRLNAGVRFEDSQQDISTYRGQNRTRVGNSLIMKDYLPALGLTYFMTEKTQLRLGYSETISRPAFKDLNPEGYFDDERDRFVSGNPNLRGTVIRNLDARFEWYFGNQENVSVGVFSKEFLNPIEEVAGKFDDAGNLTYQEGSFQLANVGNATARGFEIEFRKNFSFFGKNFEPLALGGNYARIESEMSIFDNLTSQITNPNRPLQGQSPYVVNVNLDYDNKDTGTNATVLFNVFGERIDTVGTEKRADTYQEPFNQLDFVFSQKFGENFKNKIKFKVQNIIDPEAELTQGGITKEIFRRGRRASLSFTRVF